MEHLRIEGRTWYFQFVTFDLPNDFEVLDDLNLIRIRLTLEPFEFARRVGRAVAFISTRVRA
ncbi:MAG TPA: hypothetical protein PLD59_04630 [Tepidisphaeraceae bacterium]|nr:hypothetical protein [Tepidisphaeraceae bacterium]